MSLGVCSRTRPTPPPLPTWSGRIARRAALHRRRVAMPSADALLAGTQTGACLPPRCALTVQPPQERYPQLLSLSVLTTINAALCERHLAGCPPSAELTEQCGRVRGGVRVRGERRAARSILSSQLFTLFYPHAGAAAGSGYGCRSARAGARRPTRRRAALPGHVRERCSGMPPRLPPLILPPPRLLGKAPNQPASPFAPLAACSKSAGECRGWAQRRQLSCTGADMVHAPRAACLGHATTPPTCRCCVPASCPPPTGTAERRVVCAACLRAVRSAPSDGMAACRGARRRAAAVLALGATGAIMEVTAISAGTPASALAASPPLLGSSGTRSMPALQMPTMR